MYMSLFALFMVLVLYVRMREIYSSLVKQEELDLLNSNFQKAKDELKLSKNLSLEKKEDVQAKTFSYCVKAKLEMQMYQNIKKVIQKKNAHEIVNNASTEKANNSSKKNENESNFSSVQSSLLRFGNSNFSDSKVKVIENLDVKWEIDEKLASVVEEVV
ncbi:hypothetical protein HK099_007033 [Clydaea vesicula]|uniref:Uncharacterized protein n=1 Tax=Clydaea vesicula TaxID=447962 RepID=A0AAD5U5R0_9FUNG|nr:hypothetical protein HK099_007033 [Clydaea vesicula]